eukprot:366574-Chlamydomonas_euryale.AAC.8
MPCMGVVHCTTRGVDICFDCPVVQGHRPQRRGGVAPGSASFLLLVQCMRPFRCTALLNK